MTLELYEKISLNSSVENLCPNRQKQINRQKAKLTEDISKDFHFVGPIYEISYKRQNKTDKRTLFRENNKNTGTTSATCSNLQINRQHNSVAQVQS